MQAFLKLHRADIAQRLVNSAVVVERHPVNHWTCPGSTDGLKVLDLLGIFNQIDLTVAVN